MEKKNETKKITSFSHEILVENTCDKKGIKRSLHSVLRYTTATKFKGYINRDRNAVINNETITKHYISYKKGLEKESRPKAFQRPKPETQQNGLTDEEDTSEDEEE